MFVFSILDHPENQNKPHLLRCGKTQGFLDFNLIINDYKIDLLKIIFIGVLTLILIYIEQLVASKFNLLSVFALSRRKLCWILSL